MKTLEKDTLQDLGRISRRAMMRDIIGIAYQHAHEDTQVVLNATRPKIGLILEGFHPDGRAFRIVVQEGDAPLPRAPWWNRVARKSY